MELQKNDPKTLKLYHAQIANIADKLGSTSIAELQQ